MGIILHSVGEALFTIALPMALLGLFFGLQVAWERLFRRLK